MQPLPEDGGEEGGAEKQGSDEGETKSELPPTTPDEELRVVCHLHTT